MLHLDNTYVINCTVEVMYTSKLKKTKKAKKKTNTSWQCTECSETPFEL